MERLKALNVWHINVVMSSVMMKLKSIRVMKFLRNFKSLKNSWRLSWVMTWNGVLRRVVSFMFGVSRKLLVLVAKRRLSVLVGKRCALSVAAKTMMASVPKLQNPIHLISTWNWWAPKSAHTVKRGQKGPKDVTKWSVANVRANGAGSAHRKLMVMTISISILDLHALVIFLGRLKANKRDSASIYVGLFSSQSVFSCSQS